jgi:hypothetical protein
MENVEEEIPILEAEGNQCVVEGPEIEPQGPKHDEHGVEIGYGNDGYKIFTQQDKERIGDKLEEWRQED